MSSKILVANWKANFINIDNWFREVTCRLPAKIRNIEVALAPSFLQISMVRQVLEQYNLGNFFLSSQDGSAFDEGAKTGEVPAKMLAKFGVKYVLIGHSERRENLGETNDLVYRKFSQIVRAGLIPIVCARSKQDIPSEIISDKSLEGKFLLMFEPETAISEPSGNFHPENVSVISDTIDEWFHLFPFSVSLLYGGSINQENVGAFSAIDDLSGFVVGQSSLDPIIFSKIISVVENSLT